MSARTGLDLTHSSKMSLHLLRRHLRSSLAVNLTVTCVAAVLLVGVLAAALVAGVRIWKLQRERKTVFFWKWQLLDVFGPQQIFFFFFFLWRENVSKGWASEVKHPIRRHHCEEDQTHSLCSFVHVVRHEPSCPPT